MRLPELNLSKAAMPLSLNDCLDLMQKETADFERQLKKRQLEIAMKLQMTGQVSDSDFRKIVNSLIVIAIIRLHGPESAVTKDRGIDIDLYYDLLNELTNEQR